MLPGVDETADVVQIRGHFEQNRRTRSKIEIPPQLLLNGEADPGDMPGVAGVVAVLMPDRAADGGKVVVKRVRPAAAAASDQVLNQRDAGRRAGADKAFAVEFIEKIAENSGAGRDAAGDRLGDLELRRERGRFRRDGVIDRADDRLARQLDQFIPAAFGALAGAAAGQVPDRCAHGDQCDRARRIEPDALPQPLPDILRTQRLHDLLDRKRRAPECVHQPAGSERNRLRKPHEPALEPADQQRTGADHETDAGELVERQALPERIAHGKERDAGLLLALEDFEREVRYAADPVDDQLAVECLADRARGHHPAAADAVLGELARKIGHDLPERRKVAGGDRTVAENVVTEVDGAGKALQKRDLPAGSHLEQIEPGRMRPDIDDSRLIRETVFRSAHRTRLRVRTSCSYPDSGSCSSSSRCGRCRAP